MKRFLDAMKCFGYEELFRSRIVVNEVGQKNKGGRVLDVDVK